MFWSEFAIEKSSPRAKCIYWQLPHFNGSKTVERKKKLNGFENIDKSDDNVTGYASFTTGCLAIEVQLLCCAYPAVYVFASTQCAQVVFPYNVAKRTQLATYELSIVLRRWGTIQLAFNTWPGVIISIFKFGLAHVAFECKVAWTLIFRYSDRYTSQTVQFLRTEPKHREAAGANYFNAGSATDSAIAGASKVMLV